MAGSKTNQRALSRAEVRECDRRAIQDLGVPGVVLMENAGRNATDVICRHFAGLARRAEPQGSPEHSGRVGAEAAPTLRADSDANLPTLPGRSVAIVAGTGNNGGDGFVIARHLLLRGSRVAVFVAGPPEKMTPDASANFGILHKLNVDTELITPETILALSGRLAGFDILIDAVGGTGVSGPLRGEAAEVVRQMNASGRPVVAVDIPTGMDCDTGQAYDPCVKADLTVTMVAPKLGFATPGAEQFTGKVVVVDIGVPI